MASLNEAIEAMDKGLEPVHEGREERGHKCAGEGHAAEGYRWEDGNPIYLAPDILHGWTIPEPEPEFEEWLLCDQYDEYVRYVSPNGQEHHPDALDSNFKTRFDGWLFDKAYEPFLSHKAWQNEAGALSLYGGADKTLVYARAAKMRKV